MISQRKLWFILSFIIVIAKFATSLSWLSASLIAIVTTLLIQYFHDRKVKKLWSHRIEDNYQIAKEYDYKLVRKSRDMGIPVYELEKEIFWRNPNDLNSVVRVNMHIKFSGIHVLYFPKDANYFSDAQISISSSSDWQLSANDIKQIEAHALGEIDTAPKMKFD